MEGELRIKENKYSQLEQQIGQLWKNAVGSMMRMIMVSFMNHFKMKTIRPVEDAKIIITSPSFDIKGFVPNGSGKTKELFRQVLLEVRTDI